MVTALDLDKERLRELEKSGKNSICFTDPEASMMPAKEGGIRARYNVQTAVDAKSHLIADKDKKRWSDNRDCISSKFKFSRTARKVMYAIPTPWFSPRRSTWRPGKLQKVNPALSELGQVYAELDIMYPGRLSRNWADCQAADAVAAFAASHWL